MRSALKVIPLYKNEKRLIEKAAANNREAQHRLFEIHAPKMLSVCRYYINDLQTAEEVMLNGFFKVFTKLKTFKGEGSFEGWVRRIMVRESISYLRKRDQPEFLSDEIENYDHSYDPYSELDSQEIQSLIDALPEGYRMVFVMYAIEGYKHEEIGELLNISPGTSKSQLFKARKLLQENIRKLNKSQYGTT